MNKLFMVAHTKKIRFHGYLKQKNSCSSLLIPKFNITNLLHFFFLIKSLFLYLFIFNEKWISILLKIRDNLMTNTYFKV
jgi:hypothetical protein